MRPVVPFLAWAILWAVLQPICATESEEGNKPVIESPSPDGLFAFRYAAKSETGGKSFDLIDSRSGKTLAHIAEADSDPAPSDRFSMKVLWRADSRAFAITETLWKRGSYVAVFLRNGTTFQEVKIPELLAEIPEKEKKGKSFPHIVELNSQSAQRWQKDGSLLVEIENMQDGDGTTIAANRRVVLSFTSKGHAKIVKSKIRFTTESP